MAVYIKTDIHICKIYSINSLGTRKPIVCAREPQGLQQYGEVKVELRMNCIKLK